MKLVPLVAAMLVLIGCGTTPPGVESPAAPSDVVATPGPGYVHVAWQDNSDDESGFAVYREAVSGATGTLQARMKVAEVDSDVEEYVDGSVSPGARYSYSVAAIGEGGESEPEPSSDTAEVQVGIGAMVGTINAPALGDPGTAFLILISFPTEGLTEGEVSYEISGPAGWNGDEALTGMISADDLDEGWRLVASAQPAVSGDYVVSVTAADETHESTVTLPGDPAVLPAVANLQVTDADPTAVTANWTPAAGAASYRVVLFRPSDGLVFGGYDATNASSHTFTDLELPPGSYAVSVLAFPVDFVTHPVLTSDFGYSLARSEPFVIPVSGPACISGNPIGDPGLASAIEDELGLDRNPTCTDVAGLLGLDANERGITSLAGMEYATNLEFLSIDGNMVEDIAVLEDLPDLHFLSLGDNPVSDIGALRGAGLTGLAIWSTDVVPAEAAEVVASLEDLETLIMGGVGPAGMGFLLGLTEMFTLWYDWNDVEVVPDLSALARLHELNLNGNRLDSAADLQPIIAAFSGREPEEGEQFVVFIEENFLDLDDPDVADAIGELEDMGVEVHAEPQRVPEE